ncbi:MAG: hypothetical protein ACYDG6_04790 [Thermincolia bacterium]
MMITCERCGKVVQDNPFKLCPECQEYVMSNRHKIKEYITKNPGANVFWICAETGVSLKAVTKLIRDGALKTTEIRTEIPEKGKYDIVGKEDEE